MFLVSILDGNLIEICQIVAREIHLAVHLDITTSLKEVQDIA